MPKPFTLDLMPRHSTRQRPHPLRSDYARLRRLYDDAQGSSQAAVARREGINPDLLNKIFRQCGMRPLDMSITARERARRKREGAG